jgi:hypothetical protein
MKKLAWCEVQRCGIKLRHISQVALCEDDVTKKNLALDQCVRGASRQSIQ